MALLAFPVHAQQTGAARQLQTMGGDSPAVPHARAADSAAASGGGRDFLFTEPDAGREPVLNLINSAVSSVHVVIYEIDDSQIIDALIAAHDRGADVKMLYNQDSFEHYGKDPNGKAVKKLAEAGVSVKKAGKAFSPQEEFALTHQKSITVDGARSMIMTFNFQPGYFTGTRDFGYVTGESGKVAEIEKVFMSDWDYTSVAPSSENLVWSPVNAREKLLSLINGARKTLDLEQQQVQEDECNKALIAAAKRGVKVRIITAFLRDYNDPKKDKNAAARKKLRAAGVEAKVSLNPYMHAKMILADYKQPEQKAYIGSVNFSGHSLDKNRELGVLFSDSQSLDTVHNAFEKDWIAQE
ncbi:MAG: phospholipase D-like domain-containing protein [Elusimicrobiales bacterium]